MKQLSLGELCQFQSGLWTGKKPPFETVSVIRNANFNKSGGFDLSDLAEIQVESNQLSKRKLEFGDIILEKSGGGPKQPVGRVVLFDIKSGVYSLSNFTSFMRVNDKKMCLPSYLHKYLNYIYSSGRTELIQSNSTGIRNLNLNEYKKLTVPLPSLAEQQRIVAIIDEAFAAIDQAKANTERNLKNAKELFDSYLEEVFEKRGDNWAEKTLVDLCEISSRLIDPRKNEFQNLTHIGAGNIQSKTGKLVDLKTAKDEHLISGKFLFDQTMVLYSKIRPNLVKVVSCDFEGLCSADIYPLRPFAKVLEKDFLYYLLLTKKFTDYAVLGSQRAGMPKVNREHLFAYRVKLPPFEEQRTIVKQLTTIRAEAQKLQAVYQKKLSDLDELKKSILQKAFAGELTTT